MTKPIITTAFGKYRKPGFLLEPLGWVADQLTQAFETEPTLIDHLFKIDAARMHLVALALAHISDEVPPDLALVLLCRPTKTALNLSLKHRPVGIDRALQHLPPRVLRAKTYQNLVALLDDPATAKVLHHTELITEAMITALHSLPPALRTGAVMGLILRIDGMTRFVDGLRVLAARANLPFASLANKIGIIDQPDQVSAHIRAVVDSLPLPAKLPPVEIGDFRRVDTVAEIRALAKEWKYCLADYLSNVNDGTSAIYLAEPLKAVCFVCRHGRLGWFLNQTKGPKNIDIAPDQLAEIYAAFANADILRSSSVEAIRDIVLNDEWSQHRQAPDDAALDDIELY